MADENTSADVVVSLQPPSAPPERGVRGRASRQLVRNGPLRVVLVTLAPGAELAEHLAPGPITIQSLAGRLVFRAGGAQHDIGPGQLLAAPEGVRHGVTSESGATFLLTMTVSPEEPAQGSAPGGA